MSFDHPHSSQPAEKSVLAYLIDRGADGFDRVHTVIGGHGAFYDRNHRALYAVIEMMAADGTLPQRSAMPAAKIGERCRVTPLSDVLPDAAGGTVLDGIGGYEALLDLGRDYLPGSVDGPAQDVRDLWRERRILSMMNKAHEAANNPTRKPSQVFASLQERYAEQVEQTAKTLTLDQVSEDEVSGEQRQYWWPLQRMDEMVPLLTGRVHVVAAGPGEGKTTFSCQTLAKAANEGCKCGILSLEMMPGPLRTKIVKAGAFDDKLCNISCERHSDLTYVDACSIIRRWAREGIGLVVLDYLQLLDPATPYEKGFETINRACKMLANVAKTANVALVMLSQINRAGRVHVSRGSGRGTKAYCLPDLEGGGGIEKNADTVAFLQGESVVDFKQEEKPIRWHVQKNRYGACGEMPCIFHGKAGVFTNGVNLSRNPVQEKPLTPAARVYDQEPSDKENLFA